MASIDEICNRWVDYALEREGRSESNQNASRVYYAGDTIFSYGEHFPMGIVVRKRPRTKDLLVAGGFAESWAVRDGTPTEGEPRFILLNGDIYSPSTSNHQSHARRVANSTGLPVIILPFTTLNAAGIERWSIEPIHVRKDRTETLHHSQAETPTGPMVEPWIETNDGEWGYGEPDPNRRRLNERSWVTAEFDPHTQEWHWETQRHWLGDSLFRARSNGRRRTFLSSFDYQEARPLYFLCEMPRTSDACSVEQAYEDLKPEEVKLAEEAGMTVTRQGDVFAVPTELTTRQVKMLTPHRKGRIVKRPAGGLIGTNHTATEVLFCTHGRTYARGVMYHDPGRWREPDHARRKMGDGKTWHLLVKNTVPHAPTRNRTREAV